MRKIIFLILLAAISACSSKGDQTYPQDPDEIKKHRNGQLGGEGGIKLFGESDEDKYAAGSTISVNAFMWRASLDTLSFMPLASADPLGGTILTDWYENPETPGERFKINVLILDKKLRSDGLKVAVYKQILDKDKHWRDAKVDPKLGRDLENKILARARELKIAGQKK